MIPYSFQSASFPVSQEENDALKSIFGCYYEYGERKVEEVTVLKIGSRIIRKRMNSSLMTEAYNFSEMLSVSAIACNELFCEFGPYSNKDLFQLVFQQFSIPVIGVSVETLRKDGRNTSFSSINAFRVQKPHHVHNSLISDAVFDEAILKATIAATNNDSKLSQRLIESIFLFNRGCTDNALIPQHLEAISLYSAIEKLCDLPSGGNVKIKFSEYFSPKNPILIEQGSSKKAPVNHLWIDDFKIIRGSVAHGHLKSGLKPIWSIREHLLLGSIMYPILLKKVLEKNGYYTFSVQDQIQYNSFEKLALTKPLTRKSGQNEWLEIQYKAPLENLREAVTEKLNK